MKKKELKFTAWVTLLLLATRRLKLLKLGVIAKFRSKVGDEVGVFVGLFVLPLGVGAEVVGFFEGNDDGKLVGTLVVGREVGSDTGC